MPVRRLFYFIICRLSCVLGNESEMVPLPLTRFRIRNSYFRRMAAIQRKRQHSSQILTHSQQLKWTTHEFGVEVKHSWIFLNLNFARWFRFASLIFARLTAYAKQEDKFHTLITNGYFSVLSLHICIFLCLAVFSWHIDIFTIISVFETRQMYYKIIFSK